MLDGARVGDRRRHRSAISRRRAVDRGACCRPAGDASQRRQTLDPDCSCGCVVLVDQPAQHIPAADLRRRRHARTVRFPGGSGQRQRAVRPLRVAVSQIATRDLLEMAAPEHRSPATAAAPHHHTNQEQQHQPILRNAQHGRQDQSFRALQARESHQERASSDPDEQAFRRAWTRSVRAAGSGGLAESRSQPDVIRDY